MTGTGRLRAAIAWDATASCDSNGVSCTASTLDADLDLMVYRDQDGALVCSSTTWDSSYEVCDLPVIAGETYTLKVVKHATPAASTYFGIAWYNYAP